SLSLAGLQFLAAYFAFDQGKPYSWLLFLSVVFISVYGELNRSSCARAAVDRSTADRACW
ncbi:MAG: hypothetical protein M1140_08365, partial [Chloroflexi bacterium]|nr:hypothetical protein [Chloroflexota bacterium]